jgi:sulfite exporter TauE/SafE
MLTSITPLGERGRGNRWTVTVAAYALGSVLGGVTTGALLGLLGGPLVSRLPGTVVLTAAAGACLLAAGADLSGRVRGGARQVDEDWLTRYRGWVYGLGFGYQLGLGVVTVVTSAATYAVLLLALLSGGPAAGAVLGAVFGAARAAPALGLRGATDPPRLRELARRLERRARPAARATVAALALGGALLAVGAWAP